MIDSLETEMVLNYNSRDPIKVFNLATKLQDAFSFYTPDGERSPIWYYAGKGIWVPRGREIIRAIVARSMEPDYEACVIRSVVQKIKDNTRNPNVQLGNMTPHKIVLTNGVYDLNTDTFSTDFEKEDYQIMALDYAYDAKATCPRFEQFLEEVCPNKDDQSALIEFMGYCLAHHHRYHTFLVLVGNGENGKSKFLDTLKAMLNPKNITGISLQHLAHNRFMAAQLVSKLANICPDIPDTPVKHTGIIKALTGEDLLTVEHKHQDPFEMENHAKLLFSANQIPTVKDSTDAWFRRVRIIEFPNQFLENNKKRDPDIGEKLKTELAGIFNLATKGLKRLYKQGSLTGAKSTEENRQDYIKRSSPLQYFVYQFCKSNPEGAITAEATYSCYRKVTFRLDKVPISKSWFGTRLLEMLDYAERRQIKLDGKNTRLHAGLTINLEKLAQFISPVEHAISIYKDNIGEYSVLIYSNDVSGGTDDSDNSEQKKLGNEI